MTEMPRMTQEKIETLISLTFNEQIEAAVRVKAWNDAHADLDEATANVAKGLERVTNEAEKQALLNAYAQYQQAWGTYGRAFAAAEKRGDTGGWTAPTI